MADSKITALAALTAADPVNDMFPVVDVSDTSMAASGTTKRISVNNILSSSPTASGALTVTGLVTAGSATITGALGAAGLNVTGATIPANGVYLGSANNLSFSYASTLGMTLNSTGLGVGGSPVNFPNYTTIHAIGKTTTTGGVFQTSTSNNSTAARFACSSAGVDLFVETNHPLAFYTNAIERMRIDAVGNVGIGVTPSGSGGCLQLKSGITFPATQVASSDANTLDDYEEGTWTGTLTGSTTNPTVPVTATGRYTKIGRQVSISINFESISTVGALGNIGISGLPFANNASVQSIGPTSIYQAGTFTGSPFTRLDTAASAIEFFASVSSAVYSNVTHNAGTGRFIATSITYTVA